MTMNALAISLPFLPGITSVCLVTLLICGVCSQIEQGALVKKSSAFGNVITFSKSKITKNAPDSLSSIFSVRMTFFFRDMSSMRIFFFSSHWYIFRSFFYLILFAFVAAITLGYMESQFQSCNEDVSIKDDLTGSILFSSQELLERSYILSMLSPGLRYILLVFARQ